jgi:3-methyladenine DNA glycosylase Tag
MTSYIVPPRAAPPDDAGYFEKITQAVFQAGFNWEVIRKKWRGFEQAFAGFDVGRVAAFTDEDVERLLENREIVRNGRKIEATVRNTRLAKQLIDEQGSFAAYGRSLDDLDYETRSRAFCKQFKFIGPLGAYFFFHSVGEEVPPWEEWRAQHAES